MEVLHADRLLSAMVCNLDHDVGVTFVSDLCYTFTIT